MRYTGPLGPFAISSGDGYPFRLNGCTLEIVGGAAESPYVALLSMSLVHAYDIECPEAPEHVFESTIAKVVESRGLLVANLGEVRRACGSFEEALETAC